MDDREPLVLDADSEYCYTGKELMKIFDDINKDIKTELKEWLDKRFPADYHSTHRQLRLKLIRELEE